MNLSAAKMNYVKKILFGWTQNTLGLTLLIEYYTILYEVSLILTLQPERNNF